MNKIAIEDIRILPRQRKSLSKEEIVSLADSIEKFGLLHPVTLRQNNELVAGFRRIQAHVYLGRKEILYRRKEDLSDAEAKELELDENLKRVNLTWQDEAAAIAEIHALRKESDPEWSLKKTAEFVGKSYGTAQQSVALMEEAKESPEILKEKHLVSALKKAKSNKTMAKRKAAISATAREVPDFTMKIGDAAELIQGEADASYDAILTNFPFGVDLAFKDGNSPYEDDETYITDLVMNIVPELYRVLRDDSWLAAFFDIRKITHNSFMERAFAERKRMNKDAKLDFRRGMGLSYWLKDAGFSYVSMLPAIWVKPNKTQGILGNPDKGLITSYEALVFASKGDASFIQKGRQNIFLYDTLSPSERDFSVEMPVDICEEILSMICFDRSKVLDPFAGTAAVGRAALNRGCSFTGFELDPERVELANLKAAEAQNGSEG